MQVGDKVYVYEVKLEFSKNKVEQIESQYNIIGINEYYLCIDDNRFSSIKRRKQYSGDTDKLFNQISIIDMTGFSTLDYITGVLRTTQNSKVHAYKRIKKELEKYINKKLSRYGGAIKLLDEIKI